MSSSVTFTGVGMVPSTEQRGEIVPRGANV